MMANVAPSYEFLCPRGPIQRPVYEFTPERTIFPREPLPGARPVKIERFAVERLLVAECPVKARPVHPRRQGEVVKRRRRKARIPEGVDGAGKRSIGIVGARPAAPRR